MNIDDLKKLLAAAAPGPWTHASDKLAAGNIKAPDNAALIVAAVNALPELLAMARRVEGLEHTLTLCADQFRVLRRLAEGGQIHKIEPGNKRVRISLSKAVASECEISEAKVRAALKETNQ